jgi:hypothetical protein
MSPEKTSMTPSLSTDEKAIMLDISELSRKELGG